MTVNNIIPRRNLWTDSQQANIDNACTSAVMGACLHAPFLELVLMQTTEPDKEIVIRCTCSVRKVVICHAFTETRRTMALRDNAVSQYMSCFR